DRATATGDMRGDGTAVVAVLRNECATLAQHADAVRLGDCKQKDRQEGRTCDSALDTAGSEVIGVPAKSSSPQPRFSRRSPQHDLAESGQRRSSSHAN